MSTKAKEVGEKIIEEISIPDGINVEKEDFKVIVEGENGKIEKKLYHPKVRFSIDSSSVEIESMTNSKKEKSVVGSYVSHFKNMFYGVQNGYKYKMKIVYTHFPMNVSVNGDQIVIENFFGERSPRTADIIEGVDIKIDGEDIEVSGIDKEKVGQTAANIENSTRLTGRDRRVFKDGIYIVEKDKRD